MRFLRILKYLALGLVGVGGLCAATVALMWWHGPAKREASTARFPSTPERIARGEYLANHVAACILCHSQRNEKVWSRPPIHGTEGIGSCWPQDPGSDERMCPPNITPDPVAGLGAWSDDEIARAIREEIDRQGRPVFSLHGEFRALSDEDVQSIVAYLRSLPPNHNKVPRTQLPFAMRFIAAFVGPLRPQPITQPVVAPDPKDTVAYGRYLTDIAGCKTCHTPRNQMTGAPLPGRDFSGGQIFYDTVRSANLTPDPTGLGSMDKQSFIGLFHAYTAVAANPSLMQVPQERNTGMPWLMFSGLTDQDLGAIYDYLRTVKPVSNKVEKFVAQSGT